MITAWGASGTRSPFVKRAVTLPLPASWLCASGLRVYARSAAPRESSEGERDDQAEAREDSRQSEATVSTSVQFDRVAPLRYCEGEPLPWVVGHQHAALWVLRFQDR
jgi:hypothetical protein